MWPTTSVAYFCRKEKTDTQNPDIRACLRRGTGIQGRIIGTLVLCVLVRFLKRIKYSNDLYQQLKTPRISIDEDLGYPKDTTGTVFDDSPLDADVLQQRTLSCYITQGQTKNYQKIMDRMKANFEEGTYVYFFHSWDEDCDGCIFKNRTYFYEGKNLVFKALALSPYWNQCKYVTFFDDDIQLTFSDGNKDTDVPWVAYHRMLLDNETNHPLIRPNERQFDGYQPTTSYQSANDGQFQTFRFDHVALQWPLSGLQPTDRWYNDQFFFLKVAKCFPVGFRADHRFISHNIAHRYNESSFKDHPKEVLKEKQAIFGRSIPELAPWRFIDYKLQTQRSNVQVVPSIGWHDKCRAVMEKRLDRFLNDQPYEDLASSK